MKQLFLIRHARNKLRRWRISIEDVERAIQHAQSTEPTVAGRTNYWYRSNSEWLRVTAIEEGERIVVITVTPRGRKGPRTEL